MSALAAEKGAVNLGQGFPDFDCDPQLVNAVTDAMQRGLNQYPPMAGVPVLREAIAAKLAALYGRSYDAGSEITITAGATQAIITVILAVVHPGDEVIVLEPCYDSYVPNIELAGGTVVRVPLDARHLPPRLRQDRAAITPQHARHHRQLAAQPERHGLERSRHAAGCRSILAPTDVLLISDEVYEHMVFDADQGQHTRARRAFPGWRRAPSSSAASARPTMSPAGRSAMWPRPPR